MSWSHASRGMIAPRPMADPLETIRSLLAVAKQREGEDEARLNEARTAAVTAVRLILKHNVQLSMPGGESVPPERSTDRSVPDYHYRWEDLEAEKRRNQQRREARARERARPQIKPGSEPTQVIWQNRIATANIVVITVGCDASPCNWCQNVFADAERPLEAAQLELWSGMFIYLHLDCAVVAARAPPGVIHGARPNRSERGHLRPTRAEFQEYSAFQHPQEARATTRCDSCRCLIAMGHTSWYPSPPFANGASSDERCLCSVCGQRVQAERITGHQGFG